MNPRDAKLLAWIVQEVCAVGGVTRAEMVRSQTCGNQHTSFCRQAAMALAREFTDLGLIGIGKYFNRDHQTVLYAVSVMKNVLTLADGRLRAQAWLYLQMHGRVQRRMGVTI